MVLLDSNFIEMETEFKDFDLPSTEANKVSSKSFKKDYVLLAFICNHCPYVHKIIDAFSSLASKYQDTVQFVAISSNDPEYNSEDSFENMKKFSKKHNFSFPYLFDESQEIAKAYGAVCTPDLFLYKKTSGTYKLKYHGRFEDLEKAIEEFISSESLSFEQLPSCGCSIKWKN